MPWYCATATARIRSTNNTVSSTARNISWGFASSLVNVATNLVAVPFYLHFLGTEAYGLIGFYVTLQALTQILDLGLAPTISREVARSSGPDERRQVADLLHTLGIAYIAVSMVIATTIIIIAPWIAGHWLTASSMPLPTVTQAVMLMGLNLAIRWPTSLYQGAIIGAHRLSFSSAINIAANVGAAAGTIAVIALFSPTIQAFFAVQAAFGLLQVIALGWCAFKVAGASGSRFDIQAIRRVWRFSAGMGAIALTSLAFTQLDKALLSKLIGLEQFGQYMLAVLVVSGLQVVVLPVFNTIYPRFSLLVAQGRFDQLAADYSLGTRLASSMLFPLALTLVFHAQSLVTLWTGNPALASHVAPLVAILAVGSALNGVMYFPYALQLAFGKPKIPLMINMGLLLLMAPLIVVLTMAYGAKGGAMSWALVGVIYTFVGTRLTGQQVMRSAGWRWLSKDVSIPLSISLVVVALGALLTWAFAFGDLAETATAGGVALVAAATCVAFDSPSRRIAATFIASLAHATASRMTAGSPGKQGKA